MAGAALLFPEPLPSPGRFFPILFHKRLKHISNRCVLYSGNSVIFPDDWLTQKLWLVAPQIASVTLISPSGQSECLTAERDTTEEEFTLVLSLNLQLNNLPMQQELELRFF